MAETTLTNEKERNRRIPAIMRVCLAGLGLGITLAYGWSSGSFEYPKWFFWFLASLTGAIGGLWTLVRKRVVALDGIDLLATGILVYFGASLAWTPDAGTGFTALLHALFAFIVFVSLRRVGFDELELIIPFICVAGTTVVIVRIAFGEAPYGGFGNESFVAEFLLLALPYVGAWWVMRDSFERWIAPLLIFVTLFYLLGFNEYTFSKIIFVGGPVLAASTTLIVFRHQLSKRKLIVGTALFVTTAVTFIAFGFQRYGTITSLQARFELTYNTLLMWFERPMLGHGLGSFDYVYPRFMHRYQDAFPHIEFSTISEMLNFAGAAHNDPAQLLAELGFVGFYIVSVFVFKAVRYGGPLKSRSALGYAALVQLTTTLSVCGITFVFHNPATLLLAICSMAILSHPHATPIAQNDKTWCLHFSWFSIAPVGGVLLILVLAMTATTLRDFVSHRYYAEASRNFISDPAKAFEFNRMAVEAYPANPIARRQLWIAFVQWIESGQKDIPYPLQSHDGIYAVSASTGPLAPGLLIPRIYYFILTNQDSVHADEIEDIFSDLKRRAGRLPDVYITEALYALKTKDFDRASRAINDANARIPGQDPILQEFQKAKTRAIASELEKLRKTKP